MGGAVVPISPLFAQAASLSEPTDVFLQEFGGAELTLTTAPFSTIIYQRCPIW